MIARGVLLLCVVTLSQAFMKYPMMPMKHKVQTKYIPIVKYIREPVYVHKEVRVPHYIERAIPVPYPVGTGGGVGGGVGGGAVSGPSSLNFGLNAQIEDADTVNIIAGVNGGSFSNNNNNNGFNNDDFNNNGYNDDGFGQSFGGRSSGFRGQSQPSISVSQTSFASPSARVSQPQIGGQGHGHGFPKGQSHFGGHF